MTRLEPLDHGVLNVPLAKRYGKGGIDGEVRRQMAAQQREREAESRRVSQQRQADRAVEAARPKLTCDDVRGARLVRDRFGWHVVVRVSAKSVTVRTAYSWNDRIPLNRVLEVRS